MTDGQAGTLKVLHVAETIRGGIATYLNELYPYQRASFGHGNVHYIVPSDHREDLTEVEDSEITVFERKGRNLLGLFRMALATMHQISRMRPDIVHLHSSFAGLVIRPLLLLKRGRPRVVYCPHGWAFSRETSRLSHHVTRLVELIFSGITDRIICISGGEFREAAHAGISKDRLAVVHNGISPRRPPADPVSATWPSQKTKVLFIGRLDRQKGYDLLIEAARRLEDCIDVRVIGASVIGRQQDHNLPQNVSLLGWMARSQIETHLDSADLLAIPSRWEGFGLVALEAMRAAKPVVAFRIGALPEIVEDGVTGMLCEPVSAEALVNALRRAAMADLPTLGRQGYNRFRQVYDIERTHRVLDQTYREIGQVDRPRCVAQRRLQSDLSENF